MIFGSSGNLYAYCLASRGVVGDDSGFAGFGLGEVINGRARSYGGLFETGGTEGSNKVALRPLVSLTSDVPTAG